MLAQLADALVWPLLLLRPDGTLLHANLAARQLLLRGRPLQLSPERRVLPTLTQQRPEFAAALAIAAASGGRRLLRWPGTGLGYSATLAALGADAGGQVSLLLALAPAEGRAADAQAYAHLHGLSPAETRVLQRLALGDNSTRAAAALGVMPATVRSQIVALRRKTGHSSVNQLVQALAGMPPLA